MEAFNYKPARASEDDFMNAITASRRGKITHKHNRAALDDNIIKVEKVATPEVTDHSFDRGAPVSTGSFDKSSLPASPGDLSPPIRPSETINDINTATASSENEPIHGPAMPRKWYNKDSKVTVPMFCQGLRTDEDRYHDVQDALHRALAARRILSGVSFLDRRVKKEKKNACEEVFREFPELFSRAPKVWVEKALAYIALSLKDKAIKHLKRRQSRRATTDLSSVDREDESEHRYSEAEDRIHSSVLPNHPDEIDEDHLNAPNPPATTVSTATTAGPAVVPTPFPHQNSTAGPLKLEHCTIFVASSSSIDPQQQEKHLWCRATAWDGEEQVRICDSFAAFKIALAQQTDFEDDIDEIIYSGLVVRNDWEYQAALREGRSLGQVRICFETRPAGDC